LPAGQDFLGFAIAVARRTTITTASVVDSFIPLPYRLIRLDLPVGKFFTIVDLINKSAFE